VAQGQTGWGSLWQKFLNEITQGDVELQAFLQRLAGYILTGEGIEQVLVNIWGPGGNGKSVFADTLSNILGSYAQAAAMESFTATNSDRHPTDLAGLVGSRLVLAEETQAGRKWDEQRIKRITGGSRLRARFMHKDFFEYLPTFKLLVIGNHAPEIANVDDAMRRRLHIVPFTYVPAEIDLDLKEKLKEEYPQILAWMISGCLMWQRDKLSPPEVVVQHTQNYMNEEDKVCAWLEDCCLIDGKSDVSTADLYRSWNDWCRRQGMQPGTQTELSRKLDTKTRDLNFKKFQIGPASHRLRGYRGIQIIQNNMEDLL
jgi:putative DNA primase/helicase